jgi:DNA invertase Pin-like site-specific DNA recombinase
MKMNRAIAYILVDGDVGPHSQVADTLDAKKRELVERAASLGFELTAVYADVRRELEAGRKGLRAMLSDLQQNRASALVVESFESFADPHVKMLDAFRSIKEVNARICLLNENRIIEPEEIDLVLRALTMAREFDQRLNAVRIKRGLQHASLSGKPIGRRPFEFEVGNAEILNDVQLMRQRGLSLRDICKALNSAGVKSSSQKTWHPTTIKRMLERVSLSEIQH